MNFSLQRRPFKQLGALLFVLGIPVFTLGQVVINEIHYHPASNDNREEFIEFYNSTDAPIDLSSWRMSSGVSFTFPAGSTLPPRGYLVLSSDPDRLQSLHPELETSVIYGPWEGRLSNRGESLRLRNADGETIDRVEYANEGEFAEQEWSTDFRRVRGIQWKALHAGKGRSLELRQAQLSNNRGANWTSSLSNHGTPGRSNSALTNNLPPIIHDVHHFPPIPTSQQAVRIQFQIEDENAPETEVQLLYRVNESEPRPAPIDRIPGGTQTRQSFQATIPPQSNHSVVEFYVRTNDSARTAHTWPPPTFPDGAQDANAIYQVDDRPRSIAFPEYRIIMTPSEHIRFKNTVSPRITLPDGNRPLNNQIYSDGKFNATFIAYFDGEYHVRYRTEIRNRGNGSRQRSPNNFRIDFASDDLWNGVEKLNANAQFPWLQTLGATLSFELGLLAAPSRFVHLYLNESLRAPNSFATYELYAANDVMNSDFAREFDLGNANIYRGIRKSGTEEADFQYLGDDPTPYRRVYFKETNRIDDDWTDLISLTKALSESSDEDFELETQRWIDVPQWMRFLASETFYANQETALGNGFGDDYYLYRSEMDDRFRLIPYDQDTILGQGDTGADPREQIWRATRGAAINRLLSWPNYTPLYYSNLIQLATGPLSPKSIGPLVERLYKETKVPQGRQDQIVDFARARSEFLLETIPQELSFFAPFPESEGVFIAPGPEASLPFITGQADATRTTRVSVNSHPANWNPIGASWTYLVPEFEPGLNTFNVRAFDADENLVEEKMIAVFRPPTKPSTEATNTIQGIHTWSKEDSPIRITGKLTINPNSQLTIDAGVVVEFTPGSLISVEGNLTTIGNDNTPILLTGQGNQTWMGIQAKPGAEVLLQHTVIQQVTATEERAAITVDEASLTARHTHFRDNSGTSIAASQSRIELSHCEFSHVDQGSAIQVLRPAPDQHVQIDHCKFTENKTPSPLIEVGQADNFQEVVALRQSTFELGTGPALKIDHHSAIITGNQFRLQADAPGDSKPSTILELKNRDSEQVGNLVLARNSLEDAATGLTLEGHWRVRGHNNTFNRLTTAILQKDTEPLTGEWINNLHLALETWIAHSTGISPISITFLKNISTSSLRPEIQLLPAEFLRPASIQGHEQTPLVGHGYGGHHVGITGAVFPPILHALQDSPSAIGERISLWAPGIERFEITALAPSGNQANESIPNGADWILSVAPGELQEYFIEAIDNTGQPRRGLNVNFARTEPPFPIRLNELSAASEIDWIEIANRTAQPVEIGGFTLSDDQDDPSKFQFEPDTVIPPHGLLLLQNAEAPNSSESLPFGLNEDGETVFLYDSSGLLIDQLQFGRQIDTRTMSRAADGTWALGQPTPGSVNLLAALSSPQSLRLTEYLTKPTESNRQGEFIEIHNPSPLPIDLSKVHLNDIPTHPPLNPTFPQHSYLDAQSYLTLVESEPETRAQWPLNIRLRSGPITLALRSLDGSFIDSIWHSPQRSGISQGRNQAGEIVSITQPSPGFPNDPVSSSASPLEITLVPVDHPWQFNEAGLDLGDQWHSTTLSAANWTTANGPFAGEESSALAPDATPLTQTPITTYFRTQFDYPGIFPPDQINLMLLADDGAIVYLNGIEVARVRIPSRLPINARTPASDVGTPVWLDILIIRPELIQPGVNELAVELHQSRAGSRDAVFGLTLRSTFETAQPQSLIISEILADNRSYPASPDAPLGDWVEIYNPTPLPIDLSEVGLSDGNPLEDIWQFPKGSVLFGLHRQLIDFDSSRPVSDTNTGFGLSSSGDTLYLLSVRENGTEIIDSLAFGFQSPDTSLARRTPDRAWVPARPTPNEPNEETPRGIPFSVRINEWLARSDESADWLELYNPSQGVIDLHAFSITDDLGDPTQHVFPPHSILGSGFHAWRQLIADNDPEESATHLSFRLAASGESIALFHPTGSLIDLIHFGNQSLNQTEGRLPDGSADILQLSNPSPGATNDEDGDQDGIHDQWELTYGLDPSSPLDAHFDLDQDGLSNLEEFLIGTDPSSAQSGLSISEINVTSNGVELTFGVIAGRGFLIRSKTELNSSTWTERWRTENAPQTGPISITLEESSQGAFFQVATF